MKCPKIQDLPPPPNGVLGWPWTEESERVATGDSLLTGDSPRISIITPSFNQGQFIEETIRSVLLQGYPDVEYFVIDGGSTDDSAEIIKKYSPWLAYWVSEPDRGQPHAINKGLERCTGDIVAYINSDDIYLKNSFLKVARAFRSDPQPSWVIGACYVIYDRNHPQRCDVPHFTDDLETWYGRRCGLPQPSTFLSREIVTKCGFFEESLSHAFDHEYWIRLILDGHRPLLLNTAFASFKLHDAAKTSGGPTQFRRDLLRMEKLHERFIPIQIRSRLAKTRAARRWEIEVRDGLQLCADSRWRDGIRLVASSFTGDRLMRELISHPSIFFRVLAATARNLPNYLSNALRRTVSGSPRVFSWEPFGFEDPFGEYDLWDREPRSRKGHRVEVRETPTDP